MRLASTDALISVALLIAVSTAARDALAYPVKPIRAIVPFPPGGGLDSHASPDEFLLVAQCFVRGHEGCIGKSLRAYRLSDELHEQDVAGHARHRIGYCREWRRIATPILQ